jgi:hypothetical protein
MNVGVLELVAYTVPPEWHRQRAAMALRRLLYGVMPQVVAAWCRRLGHRVHYATYYGQADPARLLPDDLDVAFVSASTQASGLAYALARLYRSAGTLTVLGGPHAKCFPADSLRFFDVVVGECSLSVLRPDRLARLRRTNCLYVAPGVESWFDYGGNVSAGGRTGAAKLDHVVGWFRELHRHVPGVQANFLFGTDQDRDPAPADPTVEVARRLAADPAFRAFHDGRPVPLPEFYHRRFESRLGKYAGLLTRADRVPVLEPPPPVARLPYLYRAESIRPEPGRSGSPASRAAADGARCLSDRGPDERHARHPGGGVRPSPGLPPDAG